MIEPIIIFDDSKLVRHLNKVSDKINSFKPVLLEVGLYMISSIDKNFKKEGRPKPWKPLSASTLARRTKGSSKILQDTGTMKNAVINQAPEVGNDFVKLIVPNIPHPNSKRGTTIRTIAEVHDQGKIVNKKTKSGFMSIVIPQRKFMMFQKEDIVRIEKHFNKYIDKAIKGI